MDVEQSSTGLIEVMGSVGDTKIIFDRNNPIEVDNARTMFNNLVGKGYLAFKVSGKNGDPADQIREFDPSVDRYILTPPMVGG